MHVKVVSEGSVCVSKPEKQEHPHLRTGAEGERICLSSAFWVSSGPEGIGGNPPTWGRTLSLFNSVHQVK